MNYLKSFGLLVIAVTAMLAFAGNALATTVTSSAGSTPTASATSVNAQLEGSPVPVSCGHSHFHKEEVSHGVGPVQWKVTTLSFTNCNYQVTVQKAGTLSTHGSSSTGNGTQTSTGMEITIHTSVGTCVLTTNNTDVGTITGSNNTGGNAVWDINSAKVPRTGGNFLCGSSFTWTGSYSITTPASLEVH
jgi:hypothetical protein